MTEETSKPDARKRSCACEWSGDALKVVCLAHLTAVREFDSEDCVWIEIEDGSGIYNTCKEGEEFHLEEGLELWPHCHWCGKKILVANDVEDEPAPTEPRFATDQS